MKLDMYIWVQMHCANYANHCNNNDYKNCILIFRGSNICIQLSALFP